ncbi:Major Facilitator Superfamily protein [Paenibacillus tianmuensis]|uniref:Major Facilitator Superfamily protein n=1 Tax=Paenibacillus tianmuensis TaxID=624147 RepID=A0A1G4TRS8_9BACL|nr:MFS transporter [Paenibacillus tianmuensis]SCW84106.1 Major Facilitator Superfamily protein [Paenibacillus tianmuensis]
MGEQAVESQIQTPFRRLTFGIMFGYVCMLIGLLTPAVLLLSFKMIEIDPTNYQVSYGIVAGVGALFALVGNPLGGAISDRTNIGFGRRRTWILIGPLMGCLALVWIGFATQIWQVIVGWCIAQLFFNFAMAAYTALIPDQVEVKKQGTMSGLLGLAIPLSLTIGMIMMMALKTMPTSSKWLLISIIGVAGPIISLFIIRDSKVKMVKKVKENISLKEKLGKIYPNPRKYPEFTWALLSKFLINLGLAYSLYTAVMLVKRMGLSQGEATDVVGTIKIVALIATAITSIIGGILSDRFGKQKPFIYACGIIMLFGLMIYSFVPNTTAFIIASIVIGLASGCFTSVDMALVARILPNKEDSAKDFGLMNVANALPQSLVPAIAPVLLAAGSMTGIGEWAFFYIVLAVCVLLGTLAFKPIPEVGEQMKHEAAALTGHPTKTI